MSLYAARGKPSGQLWSYQGYVLVHEDRTLLEWLINPDSADIVPVRVREQDAMNFSNHPDLAHLAWPRKGKAS